MDLDAARELLDKAALLRQLLISIDRTPDDGPHRQKMISDAREASENLRDAGGADALGRALAVLDEHLAVL